MKYWAKTTKDGLPGIDVPQHLLRVATVAQMLADSFKFVERYNLSPNVASFMSGLHDVGKISPGFLSKCSIWLGQNGLFDESVRNGWANMERDHSRIRNMNEQDKEDVDYIFESEEEILSISLNGIPLASFTYQREVTRFDDGTDTFMDQPMCFGGLSTSRSFAPRRIKLVEGKK